MVSKCNQVEVEVSERHALTIAPVGPKMPRGLRLLLAVLCGVSVANIYYAQPLLGQIGSDLSLPPAASASSWHSPNSVTWSG
ncbi:hypothetical protein GCM10020255_056310 [Rhodococcus baikonurensis]